jgi:hypothetical protein
MSWFQPLRLKSDILGSSLCFQLGQLVPLRRGGGSKRNAHHPHRVRLGVSHRQGWVDVAS